MLRQKLRGHSASLHKLVHTWLILGLICSSFLGAVAAVSGPRGWELREALEKLDKELYDNAPGPERPFLPDLKNPCWRAEPGSGASAGGADAPAIHCLPYAMVIGGFHCGAASLWAALYRHPLVVKTDVSRWHFWAEFDKTMANYLSGLDKGAAKVAAWVNTTRAAAVVIGAAGTAAGGSGSGSGAVEGPSGDVGSLDWMGRQQRILLDGSSSTFAFYWSPNVRAHRAFVAAMMPCWNGCHRDHRNEGPERDTCLEGCFAPAREADRKAAAAAGVPYNDASLPLLLSAVYGKRPPKMVVLMRNPVDRLYSAYWRYAHYRDKFGANPQGFTAFVDQQLPALQACMARNGSDSEIGCLLHFETWGLAEERLYFHADQLLRGVYWVWLETWLKFFDRRDLLVLRSEDYFADPVATYRRVLAFLELDPEAIPLHARIERLSKAGPSASLSNYQWALNHPPDDKLWTAIHQELLEGENRFVVNRAAALAADPTSEAAREAAAQARAHGEKRPPMEEGVRRRLAAFYAPFNQRLATLLGDPDFIRGWD